MAGRIVHVNDNVDGAVYIGRAVPRHGIGGSRWGNPFVVGKRHTRDEAIDFYRLRLKIRADEFLPYLPELREKPLACWCRKDGETAPACHGDVLLELLANHTDDELRAMGAIHGR